jgi:DNA polymerase-3 subunit alpha
MHLNLKTHYSLESLNRPEALVKKAKELGYTSVGISDSSLSGTVKFVKACQKYGLKPILGYTGDEIYIAKNKRDWQELLDAYSTERLPEDVIYVIGSPFCKLANKIVESYYPFKIADNAYEIARNYVNSFGKPSHVGLAVSPYEVDYCEALNELMADIAEETKLPLVGVSDVYYLNQEDAKDHRIQICHRAKKHVDQKEEMSDFHRRFFEHDHYYLDKLDLATSKIEALVGEYEILSEPVLPHFGENPAEDLRQECISGWRKITKDMDSADKDVYAARIRRELGVINEAGFSSYFLIVSDIIRWCNNQGWMTGPGRGSVGGSLVAYLTGITRIDPIKYGLLFERFYDKSRAEARQLPDIDSDFPAEKREFVIDYIKEKYGHDCVAQMVTFGTLKGASAIKSVLRYNDVCSSDEMNTITSRFPEIGKYTDSMEMVGEKSFIRYILDYMPDLLEDWVRIEDDEIVGDYAEYFKLRS